MHAIEIEQDIHDYLLSRVKVFGETASDVLRRELGLNDSVSTTPAPVNTDSHEFTEAIDSSSFRMARGVVGKFLELLAFTYRDKRSEFDVVLELQGRGRVYFAKSKAEIESSGNSTQPKQIPGSPYWVMTNSPTPQKREMLREVLKALGYSAKAINAAVQAIAA
ncbi:MAG: replication initiation regulator SeqA [Gammaproteobacteria bacterium]|nr:replication initiation regulator SeqA [Gammaproteobacteria bacterium]